MPSLVAHPDPRQQRGHSRIPRVALREHPVCAVQGEKLLEDRPNGFGGVAVPLVLPRERHAQLESAGLGANTLHGDIPEQLNATAGPHGKLNPFADARQVAASRGPMLRRSVKSGQAITVPLSSSSWWCPR